MKTVVGVFRSHEEARRACSRLEPILGRDHLSLLAPGDPEDIHRLPVREDMPPIGAGIGAVIGGAVGMGLGTVIFMPLVGPVLAVGVLGTLLGIGGALAGGSAGKAADEGHLEGLPVDEVYVYEDALRKGRSVVVAFPRNDSEADTARRIMAEENAESLDLARENWWIGLKDAEEVEYSASGGDFSRDERLYRSGFEAALSLRTRWKPIEEVRGYLEERYPDVSREPAFRQGYERGRAHHQELEEEHRVTSDSSRG